MLENRKLIINFLLLFIVVEMLRFEFHIPRVCTKKFKTEDKLKGGENDRTNVNG